MNREALRQQLLVGALWRDEIPLHGWLRTPARATAPQALAAYRGNAAALAERALRSAYPTIAALVGTEAFAALARHLWQRHPPQGGDIASWGDVLPAFIADSEPLAAEPYLADSARLDWAVHRATRAADADDAPSALGALADTDPQRLRLQLAPGAALVPSRFPVVAVWQAHHAALAVDAVQDAFGAARADNAFVWRDDRWQVHVEAVSNADAAFIAASIEGRPLADALDRAGDVFAFDDWLARALGAGWLAAPYTRAA